MSFEQVCAIFEKSAITAYVVLAVAFVITAFTHKEDSQVYRFMAILISVFLVGSVALAIILLLVAMWMN